MDFVNEVEVNLPEITGEIEMDGTLGEATSFHASIFVRTPGGVEVNCLVPTGQSFSVEVPGVGLIRLIVEGLASERVG